MSETGGHDQPGAGLAILDDPRTNKGTAFTAEERGRLGLEGLLPHAVEILDRQAERVLGYLDQKPCELERYIFPAIGLATYAARPLLRGLEQAHRPALENHVHRPTRLSAWMRISARWYQAAMPGAGAR